MRPRLRPGSQPPGRRKAKYGYRRGLLTRAAVRGEIQHWVATSLLDRPEVTSWAIWSSVGVSLTSVDGLRLRAVSPDARSSWLARAARLAARRSWKVSTASRRR